MHGFVIVYEPEAEKQFLAQTAEIQQQIRDEVDCYLESMVCPFVKQRNFKRLLSMGMGHLWFVCFDAYRITIKMQYDKNVALITEIEQPSNWS